MEKKVERGGKCLHIQLWDRPMACATRLLCRGAVGLVYVYDVTRRETFDALAERHEMMLWHFPDEVPPIILGALTPPDFVALGDRALMAFAMQSAPRRTGAPRVNRARGRSARRRPERWPGN
jgi:hypothetical protein